MAFRKLKGRGGGGGGLHRRANIRTKLANEAESCKFRGDWGVSLPGGFEFRREDRMEGGGLLRLGKMGGLDSDEAGTIDEAKSYIRDGDRD
jgi:hypothetical protein